MDTGTHIVFNLLLQSRYRQLTIFGLVILGALVPDLPIIFFYAWESLVLGNSESLIWSTRYYLPGWQNFFDVFNSVPIIVLVYFLAKYCDYPWLVVICIGMLLHVILDLPFHHDDAHRHFFPFSDWRFVSPISYWDLRYHGDVMNLVQIVFVGMGLVWLLIKHKRLVERALLLFIGAGYIGFQTFAVLTWN